MKSKNGGGGGGGSGGFAPLIIIAIVAVVAVGGYFAFQKSGKAPSLSLPSMVSLDPKCKYNDPDLCKYINRTLRGDYLANMYSKGVTKDKSGKATAEFVMEIDGAGKSHMSMKANGVDMMENITIEKTVYAKDFKDGKWWKQTVKEVEEARDDEVPVWTEDELKKQYEEGKTTYKKIGKEACGNLTCFKYQQVGEDLPDSQGTTYIFFDDKEYILRKMLVTHATGETTELTYEFGKVSVNAPSPTKDLPEGQNIYMMGLPGAGMMEGGQKNSPQGGPSQEEVEKMMKELQNQYSNEAPPSE